MLDVLSPEMAVGGRVKCKSLVTTVPPVFAGNVVESESVSRELRTGRRCAGLVGEALIGAIPLPRSANGWSTADLWC